MKRQNQKPSDELLRKYLSGDCTEQEKKTVEDWYLDQKLDYQVEDEQLENATRSLDHKILGGGRSNRPLLHFSPLAIAASILFVSAFGMWLFWPKAPKFDDAVLYVEAPSTSNTKIILDNQQVIDVDELWVEDTLRLIDYSIVKKADGSIKYIANSANPDKISLINTIRTEKGGFQQIELSDGSRVWLNANSEISYPIAFSEENRAVQLTGEAYFEIESQLSANSNRKSPFLVHTRNNTIWVLGTKFNVNSYRDQYQVALLHGKVQIDGLPGSATFLLSPGQVFQQGQVQNDANINRYIDWKEGFFDLNGQNMADIAFKLANWYNIEIEISDSLKNAKLFGNIRRNQSLKEILDLIHQVIPIRYKMTSDNTLVIHELHHIDNN